MKSKIIQVVYDLLIFISGHTQLPLVPKDTKHIRSNNIHGQHSLQEIGTAFHQAHHRLQTTELGCYF